MRIQIPDLFRRRSFHPTMRWWPFAAFVLMLVTCLYRDLPIYEGHIGTDPDNYVRAEQVRQLILHHDSWRDWFTTRNLQVDPPQGIDVFSRLVDVPILAIAWPLSTVMDVNDAILIAAFFLPLFVLLPLFMMVGIWAYRPLLGNTWRWLVPVCMISFTLVANEFMPGRVDHHNWQLILTLGGLGLALRLLTDAQPSNRHAVLFGIVGALSGAIGLEALPYMAMIWTAVGLRLWLQPEKMARVCGIFGVVLVSAAVLLLMALRAPEDWGRPTIIMSSWAEVALLSTVSAVFVIGGLIAPLLKNRSVRLMALGIVAVASVGTLYHFQPDLIRQGPWLGFDPWLIKFTRHFVIEQSPLAYMKTMWPATMVAIVIAMLGYRLARERQADLRLPLDLMRLLTLIAGMGSILYASRLERFFDIFCIPGLLFALRFGLEYVGRWSSQRARHAAEIVLAAACILVPGAWWRIATVDGAISELVLFPVPAVKPPACNINIISMFLPIAYPSPKRVLVSETLGPQLAWATPHAFIGGGIYDNPAGLRAAKRFFETPDPREAARIALDNKIDLIFICNLKDMSEITKANVQDTTAKTRDGELLDPNRMMVQFSKGQAPDWLKKVEMPMETKSNLFEVVPDKLEAAVDAAAPIKPDSSAQK